MTKQIIFELRPSSIHGVGVFTTGKITKGTKLPLFEEEDHTFLHEENVVHTNYTVESACKILNTFS